MTASKKYIPIQQLLDRIDDQYASVVELVADMQRQEAEGPDRLQRLADERTQAFVELAQHYLPDLNHQALANAWIEVRDQIRDILLRKEDQCRTLRKRLSDIETKRSTLENHQSQLRVEVDKARLDHCSKNGNVHKVLREDREVAACFDEIGRVNKQIDHALTQLDIAKSEAKNKLPSYEASTLFQYLQDRYYGTPRYKERGLEKRWDRWLAKLIDYNRAKKSFELLRETPDQLKVLIDEKRERYKSLLENLDRVRVAASEKFGLSEQKRLHEKLAIQLRDVNLRVVVSQQEEAAVGSKLCEIESIHGEYYFQAIEIYRKFLAKLDPEILRVYAECTESPVDDQICARARKINLDIEAESNRSNVRDTDREDLKKYKATLWELSQRLQQHVQSSSIAAELIEEFPLDTCLTQLREQTHTLDQVWNTIRESLIYRAVIIEGHDSEMDPLPDLVEATFLAAASESDETSPANFDPSKILLAAKMSGPDYSGFNGGFRIFAYCETRQDADAVVSFLEHHDIPCFTHDPSQDGLFTLKHRGQIGEVVLMVKDWRLGDATKLIVDLQNRNSATRSCPKCKSNVQAGYKLCWNCLERLAT